jgi:Iap family predicted aminopeptidase
MAMYPISLISQRGLTGVLEEEFDWYKEDTLELLNVVVGILDTAEEEEGKEIEWRKKNIGSCVEPSEIRKLRKYSDTLIKTFITALEAVYNKIFEFVSEIANENPATDVYPVEYWTREKMSEIEDLKSMSI